MRDEAMHKTVQKTNRHSGNSGGAGGGMAWTSPPVWETEARRVLASFLRCCPGASRLVVCPVRAPSAGMFGRKRQGTRQNRELGRGRGRRERGRSQQGDGQRHLSP